MISENSLEIEADGKGVSEVVSQFGLKNFCENIFQVYSSLIDNVFLILNNKLC